MDFLFSSISRQVGIYKPNCINEKVYIGNVESETEENQEKETEKSGLIVGVAFTHENTLIRGPHGSISLSFSLLVVYMYMYIYRLTFREKNSPLLYGVARLYVKAFRGL